MKLLRKIIIKHSSLIASVVLFTATVAANGCRESWYQEKEPNGLMEFAEKNSKRI